MDSVFWAVIAGFSILAFLLYAVFEEISSVRKALKGEQGPVGSVLSDINTFVLNVTLALSIVGVVLLIRDKIVVFGSEMGRWVYPYIGDFQLFPLLIGIGLSLALIPFVHLSLHLIERCQLRVIAFWFVVGLAGQLLLHSLYPHSLEAIVRSDWANSYYNASLRYKVSDFLIHFSAIKQSLPVHAQSNMPGKIFLYYGLRLITNNPRALAILIIAFSNLGGILLYFLVSDIYASRRVALSSLLLYLFIPGKTYFLPLLNIVSPIPILACLLLLVRFLGSRSRFLAMLLGIGFYVVLLFDPLTFCLGLFFVALVARFWWSGEVRITELLWLATMIAVGFLVIHCAMWFGLGFNLVNRFREVTGDAHAFSQGRPYVISLWANLWEFALSAGALPSLLCLIYLTTGLIAVSRSLSADRPISQAIFSPLLSPGPLMFVTLLVTLAGFDLTGLIRGEVVRLWIFMAVFVQVIAADACLENARRWTLDIVLAGSIIQTAVAISMVGFILI